MVEFFGARLEEEEFGGGGEEVGGGNGERRGVVKFVEEWGFGGLEGGFGGGGKRDGRKGGGGMFREKLVEFLVVGGALLGDLGEEAHQVGEVGTRGGVLGWRWGRGGEGERFNME